MPKRRKSLYTILFIRILSAVFIIYIVMAAFQIRNIVALERENKKNILNNSNNEVRGLMDSWIDMISSVDNIFRLTLENTMLRIPDTVTLNQQMAQLLRDTSNSDIKIIHYGKPVAVVAPPDSGAALTVPGQEYGGSLLSAMEAGECYVESWVIDPGSKRFKCRGYIPAKDLENMTGVEFYSGTADKLMALARQRMNRIVEENDEILLLNVYFGDRRGHFGLLNENRIFEGQDSLVSRTFSTGSGFTANVSENGRTLVADYSYMGAPQDREGFSGGTVFSIITDVSRPRIVLFDFIKVQAIIILASIILLSVLMVIATGKLRMTLKDLLLKTTAITEGNLRERVIVTGRNELTTLAEQFNSMVGSLESSQKEMKKRNSQIENKNSKLHEQNEEIVAQRDEIQAQRDEIESQRDLVLEQKDEILSQKKAMSDSIHYAVRIQKAILPPDEVINYLLPKHFILYKPRDVISGDFYWLTHLNKEIIFAVADCTGHGVPGAFMSMLGSSLLNEVVRGLPKLKANLILNELRDRLIISLRQTGQEDEANDGMDISLCVLNREAMKLQYAGANNSLYLVRNGRLKEYRADKMPIGISPRAGKSFTNQEFKVFKEDALYLFSDGFTDQFGGEENRKYLSSRFKKLILSVQDNIMYDQKLILEQNINEWMGLTGLYRRQVQIDDITVMGIKI